MSMDEVTKAKLEHLRAVTIGAPAVKTFRIVEWNGGEFEVRRPTMRQQREIDKLSTNKGERDNLRALCHALIKCVYVPGTEVQVFGVEHLESMEGRTANDFVGAFMTAIGELSTDATVESAEKNS